MKKKIIQIVLLVLSLGLDTFGIMSLLTVSGIAPIGFLSFYSSMRLILRYVIVIVFMAAGIMLFNVFAGTFKGKLKNGLSIGCCVYSTVLTVPLLLTFVGCFFSVNGISVPGVDSMLVDIAKEFMSLFPNKGVLYTMLTGGVLMSIIFLAVPIIMTVCTVKDIELFKKKAK